MTQLEQGEQTIKVRNALDQALDTFFHLPTLVMFALITGILLWQVYDLGLNVTASFIRLNSNRGQVILYWANGCCDLKW
jgi:hypothetical protein